MVIAAYNEQDGIEAVVRAIPDEVLGLGTETIVVVDGATDATAEAARRAGIMVCEVAVNRGQGAALRLGYRLARERDARYIATLDADGQYDPAELATVVAPLLDGRADLVTGSRRLGASHATDRTRAAGVVVFAALITLLTRTRASPTRPTACGPCAPRSRPRSRPEQPQYQASELLVGAILQGYRVVEVPATMHRRSAGTTKKGGNLLYGLRFSRVVVGTWWRDRHRPGLRVGSAKITSS